MDDSSNPWFNRGGRQSNGSNAGVFAFNHSNGNANVNNSFRPLARPAALRPKLKKEVNRKIKSPKQFTSFNGVLFLSNHLSND